MAGNRPRQPWLRDHVNDIYSILTPNAANDYVEGLAVEALGKPSGTAQGENSRSSDNVCTPFGFPIPSVGYALEIQQLVSRAWSKPLPAVQDTEFDSWMGAPALLTEADEGIERSEKAEKVLEGLEWDPSQRHHPQGTLHLYDRGPFMCPCGFGRPGLSRCETCGEPTGIRTPERNTGKAKERDSRN
ncbi:hypothetical protein PG985_013642 [Apiospora marii]|uniref:uncharacterized protein n=1 Tax=Apiospora marii TaxID=335849 RepID=UPI00312EA75B